MKTTEKIQLSFFSFLLAFTITACSADSGEDIDSSARTAAVDTQSESAIDRRADLSSASTGATRDTQTTSDGTTTNSSVGAPTTSSTDTAAGTTAGETDDINVSNSAGSGVASGSKVEGSTSASSPNNMQTAAQNRQAAAQYSGVPTWGWVLGALVVAIAAWSITQRVRRQRALSAFHRQTTHHEPPSARAS